MKRLLIIFIMCFLLIGCTSNNADNFKDTKDDYNIFDMYDLYTLQSRDSYKIDECSSCFDDYKAICDDNERVNIYGNDVTLSEALSKKILTTREVECLIKNNVVKHYRIPYILYKIGEFFFSIFKGL